MDKLGPVAKSLGLRVPPAAPQGLIGTPLTPLRCFLLLTQSKYNKYLYQGGPRAQRQAQQEWKLNEFHDAQVLHIWPFRSLFWNAYGSSPFSNCVQFCNNLEKGLSFLSVRCSFCSPFCRVSSKKTTGCTYVQTSINDICVCLVIQEIHESSLHKMMRFHCTQTLKIVSTFLNERTPPFQQPCPKRRIKSSTRDRNQCSFPINMTQGIFDSQKYVWGI